MQTGNGSASSADQRISVTGVGCCAAEVIGAPVPASNSGSTSTSPWPFRVATEVSRTAQRCRMSASAAAPVCGPIIS